jgi:hypothetical protein
MVESTVILSARISAELATLAAGACAFADFSPIAGIQSAAAAEIEIKQRKGVLIRRSNENEISHGGVLWQPYSHCFVMGRLAHRLIRAAKVSTQMTASRRAE